MSTVRKSVWRFVHQERGVNADDGCVSPVDEVGMCMAAEPRVGLIQRDPVPPGQRAGGCEASDATSDNRHRTG
jgi:hypothetical protein